MNGREIASKTFIQACVIASLVLFVFLLLYAAEIFLVAFAGLLLAVLFHGMSAWISNKTGMSSRWALSISLISPFLFFGILIWFLAPEIASQANELADRIPTADRELEQQLMKYDWINRLEEQQQKLQEALPSGSKAVGIAGGFVSSTFGALGNLVIALAIGIFLSISPNTYFDGLIKLVPVAKRARAREVLEATRSALASWLGAKLIAMVVIGVLTTVGLWLIGIDLALVLGIIAAILSFVPNIGPIIALVPALLIAMVSGLDHVTYVVMLYVAIQTVESYVLTPLLQQRMVDLPPALTITMQVLFGFLAGALGIILATPLTAAAMVMTQMWYVEDLLRDKPPENG